MAARGRFTVPLSPFMSKAFAPSFQDFQKDIERCLQSKGQVEKNELGRPLLKELWVAVVAKRRTNYNKTRKAQKSLPNRIPDELVTKTQDLLLESLYRLQRYASELGYEADVREYLEMIARVEKRRKA